MSDVVSKLLAVLSEVVLPNLHRIQNSQAEQRAQSDRLHQDMEEFRLEMHTRFNDLRADLAATRTQLERTEKTLRDSEAARLADSLAKGRKPIIH